MSISPGHEAYLHYEATHDELTGLPNRRGFEESLSELLREMPGNFALFIVDLDGLKEVNDTESYLSGDSLLRYTADVLRQGVRHNREDAERYPDTVARGRLNTVARTGGDEFPLLFPGASTEEDLQAIQERLASMLDKANISASVGGSLHSARKSRSTLLIAASSAVRDDKKRRKLELYPSPEKRAVILTIGALASEHNISLRDLPTVYEALREQEK